MLIDYKLYVREVKFNFLDLPTPDLKMDKQITPTPLAPYYCINMLSVGLDKFDIIYNQ